MIGGAFLARHQFLRDPGAHLPLLGKHDAAAKFPHVKKEARYRPAVAIRSQALSASAAPPIEAQGRREGAAPVRGNPDAALHEGLGWALNTQALGDPTQRQSARCQPGTAADLTPSAGRPHVSRLFRRGFEGVSAEPLHSRKTRARASLTY